MELLEIGKTPISEDNPAGEDYRFEPEYEAIQSEIDKLSSPTANSTTDWGKVKKLSEEFLSTKSKDLLIAAYLSVALLYTDKTDGIYPGAVIINDMLHNFWDTMYPPKKRKKGRINAILWWKERLENLLPSFEPVTCKKEERENIINQFREIDEFLGENLEEIPPLRSLIDAVSSLFMEAEESPPEQPTEETEQPTSGIQSEQMSSSETSSQPSETPSASQYVSSSSFEVEIDTDDPIKVLEKGLEVVSQATTLMAKNNPFDPEIFRLNRICSWLTVDTLPLAENGKTMLPPPDEAIVSALKRLYESQNWNGLIEAAESYIPQFLFWLDLSRYSFEALSNLNQVRASEAVARETIWYIEKLPGIEKLSFSDGTPFADEFTLEWLREIKKKGSQDESSTTGATDDKTAQKISEVMKGIQEKVKNKQLTGALLDFKKCIEEAACEYERFLWYIEICNFLLKIKKTDLLMPYVQKLLKVIEEYKLEEWSPDICVKALEVALKAVRSMGRDEYKEMEERILYKLSFLNPAVAIEFV
ncbi:type VI secretion system protein TssA [Deferribacter abyssi]|uniref:type VI secretion system protein TssA n=1 Tax=Deferribacter abyssi TaxID=213806 RepID=UPI003C143A6A